jgi:MerR family transcriptional regulator, mercuric resistance operon regulatory protein
LTVHGQATFDQVDIGGAVDEGVGARRAVQRQHTIRPDAAQNNRTRIGLLPKPRRQGGRFRRYGADDVAKLRFIRRTRQLGFRREDVRSLVRLAAVPAEPLRAEARQLAAAHVAEVRAKIADLQAMERILTGAICDCDAGRGPACPIIEALSEA